MTPGEPSGTTGVPSGTESVSKVSRIPLGDLKNYNTMPQVKLRTNNNNSKINIRQNPTQAKRRYTQRKKLMPGSTTEAAAEGIASVPVAAIPKKEFLVPNSGNGSNAKVASAFSQTAAQASSRRISQAPTYIRRDKPLVSAETSIPPKGNLWTNENYKELQTASDATSTSPAPNSIPNSGKSIRLTPINSSSGVPSGATKQPVKGKNFTPPSGVSSDTRWVKGDNGKWKSKGGSGATRRAALRHKKSKRITRKLRK